MKANAYQLELICHPHAIHIAGEIPEHLQTNTTWADTLRAIADELDHVEYTQQIRLNQQLIQDVMINDEHYLDINKG